MLEIKNLEIKYGSVAAIRGVTMRVREGEIVSLLGANGAGKSSLLGGVAGLVPVASGSVLVGGEEVTGRAPERVAQRGVSLVPEGRRVFPDLTVAENLAMGAAMTRDTQVVTERLDEVHSLFPVLRDRSEQKAGTLSGGQQQMLAIGRALMGGPRLLLLDEPSLGLAPIVMEEIFSLIGRLRDGGVTILLVEQNAHRALELADRAYVLATGRIESEGTASEVAGSAGLEGAYLGDSGTEARV